MHASPRSSRAGLRSFGATFLIGLLVAGVVLGACGGSGNSATKSSTTPAASSTTSAAASAGSSDLSQLRALSSEVQAGKGASYKATYTSHSVSGTPQTITIEQKPPKSVFTTSSGSVINEGTRTYFCTSAGAQQQCVSESSTGANPFQSITNFFDPTTLLSEFRAAEAAAGSHTAGYSVAFSDSTYAGLQAKCLHYTSGSQTVTYCVTDSGILAYAQSAGGTFELTGFSSTPPASDFALPAGATIVTVPNVSVP